MAIAEEQNLDLLETLHDEMVAAARRLGVTANVSVDLAMAVESGIRRRCGGDSWYVPTEDKSARDSFIFVAYSSGEPVKEIAHREGMHVTTVYRILKGYGVSWETDG